MPTSDIFAAIRWWAVLMILGTAVSPLAYYLFKSLPDRGYAFTKMMGLLLVSYLFWFLGSLGFLGNNLGGILFALAIVVGLSVWTYRHNNQTSGVLKTSEVEVSMVAWLRQNWRQVFITELVFALVFALWVYVRAQNPLISATEKPMEFAFLNAASRTPAFPPLDPWLAGYAISYYYFGYVMTSMIARLALVSDPIAFNLGIAWLVAGTAVGAFGIVYNLIMADKVTEKPITLSPARPFPTRAILLGLIAAIALPIAGNMQMLMELLHANGVGTAEFWQWLDVRDINTPATVEAVPRYQTFWWWWRSSRVIHEYHLSGRAEEGLEPIAEFPGFSFLLGDMHPHVLALPFAFLSLAVAFAWFLTATNHPQPTAEPWSTLSWQNRPKWLIHEVGWPLWLFTVILLGGLAFLNTWDVLIYLFVVLGAFVLGQWRKGNWNGRIPEQTIFLALLLIIPAYLLYFPFFIGFRSQAGPPFLLPMLMRPTRLPHFLIIFGMPLWVISIFLLTSAIKQRFQKWQTGIITAVSLLLGLLLLMFLLGWVVASSADYGRVVNLAQELGFVLPTRPEGDVAFGWGISAVFTLLPAILSARLAYPALTLFLGTLFALTVMAGIKQLVKASTATEPENRTALPFVLLLMITGILLTLGPEFVYLKDNFGQRLNTIFKFYYQGWVMFGVTALVALDYLWHEAKTVRQRVAPMLASAGYGLALIVALYFPYYGVSARTIEYRGPATAENRKPLTLNGLIGWELDRPDEYAAIMWLRENTTGMPIVLEAVGGAYSDFARAAANTGLPTVLGWANHEHQWRGSSAPNTSQLEQDVREIYTHSDWNLVSLLLNKHQVEYIYVGSKEFEVYGLGIQEQFANRLEIAFQSGSVTIYRWKPVPLVSNQ